MSHRGKKGREDARAGKPASHANQHYQKGYREGRK